ncbi:DUF2238 domain-containing protein [Roseibacillus persicicus]|uniref:DUF2238 domain-containing protein n=1 Tax=Roseibacillus persicicus TaxID=454148 RepID=UPI00280EF493|nr:DUF2238 domain-containing protein [Roseibacillus persicicus]MDQ8188995.1 DUF2238 domain-containing protein [Roseibacillus persicicus]
MTQNSSPNLRSLIIFSALYMVLGGVTAYLTENGEFVFYLVVLIILAALISRLHRQVQLTSSLLWALSIWGLLHVMGGMVPVPETWKIGGPVRVLYSLWLIPNYLKYDQVVHAYGFCVATLVCWHCLSYLFQKHGGQPARPQPGPLLIVLFAGSGLGALNEVIEFVATLFIEDTNVGDYANTAWDMVFNLMGGLIALGIIRFRTSSSQS